MVERGWKWELMGLEIISGKMFGAMIRHLQRYKELYNLVIHQNVSVQEVLGGNDPIAFRSDL
jgi:hypothetical protein